MTQINVGFKSSHWIKLMELSQEYKLIAKAFDDDNQEVMAHAYQAMVAINDGDTLPAMSHAKEAVQSAMVGGDNEPHSVECPFCKGSGVLELEYTPRRDPDTTKSVTASCSACIGGGSINVSKLFNEYADEVYPENAIAAILSKDYNSARQVATGVFNQIEGHRKEVEENSLDQHMRY